MTGGALRRRIEDQYAYRSDRADIWRAFDLVLDTDAYLNLGYSPRYLPHAIGNPQRRLVTTVGEALAAHRPDRSPGSLLDLGCGRGGPARHLADRFGYAVTGLDLVPYNVGRATDNTRDGDRVRFVVGDATTLPFRADSFDACTAIDAVVYIQDRPAAFAAVATALRPGGVFVLSDLLVRPDVTDAERASVEAFADAWDMTTPGTVANYRSALEAAGFDLVAARDLTPNSVGRFRRWTGPVLRLLESPIGPAIDRLLRRTGLSPSAIHEQVERAHRALPSLHHGLLVARRPV